MHSFQIIFLRNFKCGFLILSKLHFYFHLPYWHVCPSVKLDFYSLKTLLGDCPVITVSTPYKDFKDVFFLYFLIPLLSFRSYYSLFQCVFRCECHIFCAMIKHLTEACPSSVVLKAYWSYSGNSCILVLGLINKIDIHNVIIFKNLISESAVVINLYHWITFVNEDLLYPIQKPMEYGWM